jgi:hypothetical protein
MMRVGWRIVVTLGVFQPTTRYRIVFRKNFAPEMKPVV